MEFHGKVTQNSADGIETNARNQTSRDMKTRVARNAQKFALIWQHTARKCKKYDGQLVEKDHSHKTLTKLYRHLLLCLCFRHRRMCDIVAQL